MSVCTNNTFCILVFAFNCLQSLEVRRGPNSAICHRHLQSFTTVEVVGLKLTKKNI
jgi:hypothetical protein